MNNLDIDHHANPEISLAGIGGLNPSLQFYIKFGFVSGTFYTDLESAIALRFELDNAIREMEKYKRR